jgi:hypothetical protein
MCLKTLTIGETAFEELGREIASWEIGGSAG